MKNEGIFHPERPFRVHKFTTLADYIEGRFDSKLFSVLLGVQNGIHQNFGAYQGFWGLIGNVLLVVILNPMFVKQAKERNNPVLRNPVWQ